jgi:hypothetical protein
MVENLAEVLDGVERRTAYRLAGLEVPDDGTLYEASFDGTTTVRRKPPELPSGRALLTYLLREGRSVKERPVVVAKEAAICELLLGQPAKGEGNN